MKLGQLARAAALAAAACLMGLCLPAAAADPDLSGIHTIGVISAIGHSVALKNVGFMVFSNSLESVDSSGWGIDDKVQSIVADALKDRFTVKPIAVDPVAFSTQATSWWNLSEVPVEDLVAKLPERDSVDAFLVCYPIPVQDPVYGTNQYMRGLGLYRRGGIGEAFSLYALYRCDLIDAKTDKALLVAAGSFGRWELFSHSFAIAPGNAAMWAEHAADLTDGQRDQIKSGLLDLVAKSLPWALANMHLAPEPASAN